MDELAFDDLKLFARVAALGTLSAVARERDVPVSQVSRALSRIEKTCRARLVHRSTHGLALTAEGETFLAHCHRITGSLDELEAEFAARAGQPSGRVRVAAASVVSRYLLVPSLPGLHERYPQLRVDVDVSDQVIDMARDAIDIAIRSGGSVPDTAVARRIGTLGRALYAAPSYVAAAGLPRHPDELHHHRLITNTAVTQLNHWPFIVDGHAVNLPVEGHWRTNDTGMAARMMLQGLGIGRLVTLAGEPLVGLGRLVRVLPEFVDVQDVPLYAVIASTRERLPKIKACVDYWAESIGRVVPTV